MTLHDTKIITLNLNTGELVETKIPTKVLDPDKVGVKTPPKSPKKFWKRKTLQFLLVK